MPLRVPPLVFCGILASASAAALPLAAQEPERPDSSDLRGDARSAQSAFERLRVRRLPRELMGSGGCDEVIGRICMRHDGDDDFVPPPEDEDITEGRERLLAELADIGRAIPGDDWVLGQRVWYAIEAGRPEEAIELPQPCAATPWWCAALEGLALHAAERFEDAERAFGRALQAMPEETRAAWDDATQAVLGRERLGWLEEQPDRDAALERFWRLADPSWMVPGNDRRTAHWARLTASGIRDRARNAYGLSWGFDLEELLIRYGWEISWGRDVWRAGQMEDRVVGHHPPRSREYAPPEPVLADPAATAPDDWALEGKRPHTAYAPTYAPDFGAMLPQHAAFRREEGVLLIVAPDSADVPGERGLVLLDLEGERTVASPDTGRVQQARVPWGRWMISAEWIQPDSGRARRARFGAAWTPVAPDVPTLSDLLLVTGGRTLPITLEDAVARAHPGRVLRSGQRLALAWELYRFGGRAEEVAYRVLLEPTDTGLFRRAGEWMGVLDPERPVVLAWSEVDEPAPEPHFRSVDLTLPELEAGAYRLSLEVQLPGRAPLVAVQRVRVLEEGEGRSATDAPPRSRR